MRGVGQLVDFIHHLKCAYEYMDSFRRDRPGTRAERLAKDYAWRLEWIYKDLVTKPDFPQEVRDGLRNEWQVDTFATSAIVEKLALLRDDQRQYIENIIDMISKGEQIIGTTAAVTPNGVTDEAVGNVAQ